MALFALATAQRLRVGVAQRFHRRNPAAGARWLQAGNAYSDSGEERRADEDPGIERDRRCAASGGDHKWHEHSAEKITDDKPEGNTDEAESARLAVDDLFELALCGAEGFQPSVETNIGGNGDLENVVDDEITANKNEHHADRHWEKLTQHILADAAVVGDVRRQRNAFAQASIGEDFLRRSGRIAVIHEIDVEHGEPEDAARFPRRVLIDADAELLCEIL